jgi:hypothetical protein
LERGVLRPYWGPRVGSRICARVVLGGGRYQMVGWRHGEPQFSLTRIGTQQKCNNCRLWLSRCRSRG